jgi:hypothetical protein
MPVPDPSWPMKYWKYTSPRVQIPQTGQAANQNNPPCGNSGNLLKAVDILARLGAAAVDQFLEDTFGVPTFGRPGRDLSAS